jgi:hypothetical protein
MTDVKFNVEEHPPAENEQRAVRKESDASQKKLAPEQNAVSNKMHSRIDCDFFKKTDVEKLRDDNQIIAHSLNEISIESPVKSRKVHGQRHVRKEEMKHHSPEKINKNRWRCDQCTVVNDVDWNSLLP